MAVEWLVQKFVWNGNEQRQIFYEKMFQSELECAFSNFRYDLTSNMPWKLLALLYFERILLIHIQGEASVREPI